MPNLKMNNCVFAKKFTHSLRNFIGFDCYLKGEYIGKLREVNSIGKLVYFSFEDKHFCIYLRKGDHLEYNMRLGDNVANDNILFVLGHGFVMSHLNKLKIVIKNDIELAQSVLSFGADPTATMNSYIFFNDINQYVHLQKNRNICSFLLDQKIIAGLSPNYVNKILNKNFISPLRTVGELDGILFEALIKSIVSICNRDFDANFNNSDEFKNCTYCFSKLNKQCINGRNYLWCKGCQNG